MWVTHLVLGLWVLIPAPLAAQYYGKFGGKVVAEWLPDGRTMKLVNPFTYWDPAGGESPAPSGSEVDGASIPQFAWSLMGGPFEGRYRDASVIHDVACQLRQRPWEQVHLTFYFAMLASGANSTLARVMYGAVYHFGPRWTYIVKVPGDERKAQGTINRVRKIVDPRSKLEVKVTTEKTCVAVEGCRDIAGVTLTTITVPPAPQRLTESKFEALRSRIEKSAESGKGDVTLDEIRNYGQEN